MAKKQYIVREVGFEALMAAIVEQAKADAENASEKAYDAYITACDAADAGDTEKWKRYDREMKKWDAEKADAEKGIEEWRKALEDLLLPTVY